MDVLSVYITVLDISIKYYDYCTFLSKLNMTLETNKMKEDYASKYLFFKKEFGLKLNYLILKFPSCCYLCIKKRKKSLDVKKEAEDRAVEYGYGCPW